MIHTHFKSKFDQIVAVKEDNNAKKPSQKKIVKNETNAKNGKSQGGKIGLVHSSSKTKIVLKPGKNNENVNNLNLEHNGEVCVRKAVI